MPARILIVVGTRPETIKMAPVYLRLKQDSNLQVELCAVGQQRALLDSALREWKIDADHRLDLLAAGCDLSQTLATISAAVSRLLASCQPDLVMVHGDTTTTLGSALAAFYAGVPLAHVEAGLRTGDLFQPFPEEMHRIAVDRVSDSLYAPTERARANLIAEGYPSERIALVGNTGVDALRLVRKSLAVPASAGRRRVLVTGHRRENFGAGTQAVCRALRRLVELRPDVEVIYVLHPNPRASDPAREVLQGVSAVRFHEPVDYRDFIALLQAAHFVLTDSGGIQEEAPYLGTPVLVTRDVTERIEAVEAGSAWVVGTTVDRVLNAALKLLDDRECHARMARPAHPFGDGHAAERIHADLVKRFRITSCA